MTEKPRDRCIHSGVCRFSPDDDDDCFGNEYALPCEDYRSLSVLMGNARQDERNKVLDEVERKISAINIQEEDIWYLVACKGRIRSLYEKVPK
jgi:hypothetical protein